MKVKNAHLVIIGYGSQAKAWARNLRDSGYSIKIALRQDSASREVVIRDGFESLTIGPELSAFQNFVMLTPDHTHESTLEMAAEFLKENSRMIYAHGYSFHKNDFKNTFPHIDHLLLAPKAIASEVRFQYETNGKLGAGYSVEGSKSGNKEANKQFLFELAKDLGITAGPYEVTFWEETQADLFSEQSILCSTLPYAALHSYNKLRERGIPEEIAYMECWLEVKLIADALIQMGPQAFFDLISPNALIGGEKARHILFDKNYQEKLELLMRDIESGHFYNQVDETDVTKLRQDISNYWSTQELTETHNKLAPLLYKRNQ